MEQGANLRGITGYQCRLEGLEPGRNGTPMLFRNLELTQGLINSFIVASLRGVIPDVRLMRFYSQVDRPASMRPARR
ncbi:hypothetical protein ACFQU2_19455 [Siccirubricoccus deserti]